MLQTDNYLKNSGLSENEIKLLREKFKMIYASEKGWDISNLTSEQIFEIQSQKDWRTPGLLLS